MARWWNRQHNNLKFTAPLTAITAAVVGVIVNLAIFFGYHVLWPRMSRAAFDWVSALIALAAGIALFRFKRNVIHRDRGVRAHRTGGEDPAGVASERTAPPNMDRGVQPCRSTLPSVTGSGTSRRVTAPSSL